VQNRIEIQQMTHAERYIIESYSGILENLSPTGKLELLEKLAKSLKKNETKREKDFFKSFGAFGSEKSTEEIISELKETRQFREKDLKF
jgi:hypothetical protein